MMAMFIIVALTMCVGAYYTTLMPRLRGIYQGASWQEALFGAESGVDYTLSQLNTWAPTVSDPNSYPWTTNAWNTTSATYATNGQRTLADASLPHLGGNNNVRVTRIAVDIYSREQVGSISANWTNNPWFRIRSTARANLPGTTVSADRRDQELRRMQLSNKTLGAADPCVTRTVEVIARPRYRFSRAITAAQGLSLGNSSNWLVDSFDSTDSSKSGPGTSAGGIYDPAEAQSNGGIASAQQNPDATPYGTLITGNGAVVKGDVQTAGGDDPNTVAHENVSGSTGMDPSRITDDFNEDISPTTAPTWTSWTYQGSLPTSFVTGTKASPTRYALTGNLSTFAVTAPAAGTIGYVEIIVSGNLSTGNGNGAGITIPPNVNATIWVNGNIDFGNGSINSNSSSSQVASHLTVYGTGNAGSYTASGNCVQILSFYGPNYATTLNGTVTTVGSIVAKSFSINGGGNGGFHYDEALGVGGAIAGWQVASYMEDTRADL